MADAKEIEALVGELETRVDRLRALYEQYFMGIERMAPAVPQKDVERRIQVLRKEQIRNTAVRFRFQMILQRYNTYQTHWMRICRQIEEGTYKRDLLRAQRRFSAPKPADESVDVTFSTAPPEPPKDAPVEPVAPPVAAKVPEPPPSGSLPKAPPLPPPVPGKGRPPPLLRKPEAPAPGAAPPAPAKADVVPARAPHAAIPAAKAAAPPPAPKPAPSPGDLSDDRLRQIYSQYVQSRRAQKESTAALTYDAMAKSLRESSQKLREKHGKSIDFEVTVKDGKTILRPVVKR